MQKETYHENQENEIFKIKMCKICFRKKGPPYLIALASALLHYPKKFGYDHLIRVHKGEKQL